MFKSREFRLHPLSRALRRAACVALPLTLSLYQAQAAELSGLVELSGTDQRARGAHVVLLGTGQRTTTDADGRFVLNDLAPGTYELEIKLNGAKPYRQTITIADGDNPAQTFALVSTALEHITVVGQGGALGRSLSRQRNADNIVTAASADAIGEFPDSNASESLQRLPGLSIERDQGEGRYVRVRGLAPDLNAVTYNGSRLTSPDAGSRAIGLDVIPSDLLQSIEVTKTLTPDMDADSLGGAIEIKSLSAFDKPDRFVKLSAEGSYDDHQSQWGPKVAATYSDRFALGGEEDSFGVALSGSWFNRRFGSENVETGGSWAFDDGQALLEETEMRDYQIERERLGLAANFDWRPTEMSNLFLRTLYSRFNDEETRNALVTEFDDGVVAGQADLATEHSRELKSRTETQTMRTVVLGGEHKWDAWTASFQGGWSLAETDRPDAIAGAAFEQELDAGVAYADSRKPVVSGPEALYQSSAFELDEVETESNFARDEEYNLRLDLAREFDLRDLFLEVKGGAKISRRKKENQEDHWVYEEFGDASELLNDYASGPVDYSLGRFGPGISEDAIHGLVNQLDRNDAVDELESIINDYQINEDINAGFLMFTGDWGDLRAVTGVRYEATRTRAKGWAYSEIDDAYSRRDVRNDYQDWFPSAQLRYALNDNVVLRAAWTESMVRPTFEQMAPGYLLEGDEDEIEASFGNPDLKPLTSSNYDLSAEYYGEGIGVLSLGLFYKDIKQFIYQADLAGTGDYQDFEEAVTYVNGDTAKLYGAEFNAAHQFSELPAPWNGLLLSTNLTLSRSDATIGWYDDGVYASRDIAFPSQSDVTGNLALGYENQWLSLRLSAAYKSEYLQEVSELDDARYDVYADDHLQFDFIAKGHINKKLMVYFKALNLTDEPYYAYTGQRSYNAQYEQYGRTYQLGLSYIGF